MNTNTGTRYFYTDTLAAAWMAKHFGMLLQITYPGGAKRDVSKQELLTTKPLDWLAREFCIHPDSLHLLEPKVGDVIRDDVDHEYQTVWKDEKGLGMDTSKGTASPSGIIIQRNGRPFHWPEREEV